MDKWKDIPDIIPEEDMNEDLAFLREQLEAEQPQIPESLSEDRIRALLAETPQEEPVGDPQEETAEKAQKKPLYRRHWVRRIAALAACLILTVVMVPQVQGILTGNTEEAREAENAGLTVFGSYAELKRTVKPMIGGGSLFGGALGGGMAMDSGADIVAESSDMAASEEAMAPDSAAKAESSLAANGVQGGAATAAAGSDHSETYIQVENVREADIIKTDGDYIYYLTDGGLTLKIAEAKGEKTEVVGFIDVDTDGYLRDFYLDGDRLITIGATWNDGSESSLVTTYDISDRSEPKMVNLYKQDGDVVASRMTGGHVYLVTNYYPYSRQRVVPYATCEGSYQMIPVKNIGCFPGATSPSYVIVGAVDTTSGSKVRSKTKAVLGASNDIYCTQETLYVANTIYEDGEGGEGGNRTVILKVALNDGSVKFITTGKVNGSIYGSWAMDEKDGYFRIATTSYRGGADRNNLYVLDQDLKKVGSVTGFARDEHIEAVRFIGDKAYVITYEQTDPLFILDLSNPKDPVIEGSVKISGFSTLLVPIGSDKLLGLGYRTSTTEWGEATDGLKIALFDISDPSNPKVVDSKEFERMDSEVQYDHRALLVNDKKGYYAIPYRYYEEVVEEPIDYLEDDVIDEDAESAEEDTTEPDEGESASTEEESPASDSADTEEEKADINEIEEFGGVLLFTADGKIEVKDRHIMNEGVSRCVYIGDYIYALRDDDQLQSILVK